MKVLHLIGGGDTGGAKTHLLSLLSGLNKYIEADLVSFREGDFSDEAISLGIPTTVIPGNNIPAVKKALLEKIKSGKYDIIHCHGSRANMMGALCKSSVSVPVISTIHSDYKLDYLGRPIGALTFGNINKIALRCMDYRIGVSDAMVDILISRGFNPERFYSIYNGLDFDEAMNTVTCGREYLQSLGVDTEENDIIVGIAARLDPVKDVSTLIKGFAGAYESDNRLRLVIAGDGLEKEKLIALAEELKVSHRVHFVGWISGGMTAFYRSLDINTLTSLSETFPYALTEGAREGCATIASAVGGIPKLISDGLEGYTFPAGDDKTLAKKIIALAGSKSLRDKFGKALYKKASEKFSLSATIKTQLSIYNSILEREKITSPEKDGALICGAYGKGNSGDEAILLAIVNELREINPYMPIRVLSRSPLETKLKLRVNAIHTFNVFKWQRALKKTKLYINGGGNLIQDVTSSRSLWYYLYNIYSAKKHGCFVQMYGCGIGPVISKKHKKDAARCLNRNVDLITLREEDSFNELREMGVTKPLIQLTADPALTLQPAPSEIVDSAFEKNGIPLDRGLFAISLRMWEGFEEKAEIFGKLADYIYYEKGLFPVFFSVENKTDPEAAAIAAEKCSCPHGFIVADDDVSLTIGMLSRFEAVLSMRLHTLIFSASQGIPVVGAVYDPKVSAFLKYICQERFESFSELSLPGLISLCGNAISEGENKELRLETVRKLRELEKGNTEMALQLLAR